MEKLLTVWSIRLAVCCLFCFLIGRRYFRVASQAHSSNLKNNDLGKADLKNQDDSESEIESAMLPFFKFWPWLWTVGSMLSFLHMLFAMGFVHHWSHASALEDTANQTDELLGIRVGVGIYFNYLFVLIWCADATWLIVSQTSYLGRNVWWDRFVYGYLIFIAINGAIVFEAGLIRWVTVVLVIMLGTQWLLARRESANPEPRSKLN